MVKHDDIMFGPDSISRNTKKHRGSWVSIAVLSRDALDIFRAALDKKEIDSSVSMYPPRPEGKDEALCLYRISTKFEDEELAVSLLSSLVEGEK